MAKPGAPRSRQPLLLRSLADLGVLQHVPGQQDPAHQPEVPLSALPVIDHGSATSAIEDEHGNVHVTISSAPAIHPALDKDSTMTITTSSSGASISNIAAAAHQAATQGAGAPVPGSATEHFNNLQAQRAQASPAADAAPAPQSATTQGATVTTATATPSTPVVVTAAATDAPRRQRRLFVPEPVGNFEEAYQATLGLEAQTASIRERLANHSQILARHDGEIDDLNAEQQDHATRIKALEARKSSSNLSTGERIAVEGATAMVVGAGIFAGVAAVGIAADYLFGSNLVTAPVPAAN